MKRGMQIALTALLVILIGTCALADGGGQRWVHSRLNGEIPLATWAGEYGAEWHDITGFGGVTIPEHTDVRIISRNASVWSQPKTNSKKLGTAQNGENISGRVDESGRIIMQDGFYGVTYKGQDGWVNSAYAVSGALEIVLLESNVPAYCAPDRQAKRVGSLSKLTSYTVLGFYGEYYVVSLREAAAFIPMSVRHYDSTFMRLYHASMSWQGKTTAKTTVRTGPGADYASVGDVNAGYTFTCFDEIDGWYLTVDDDSGCFVYIDANDADVAF